MHKRTSRRHTHWALSLSPCWCQRVKLWSICWTKGFPSRPFFIDIGRKNPAEFARLKLGIYNAMHRFSAELGFNCENQWVYIIRKQTINKYQWMISTFHQFTTIIQWQSCRTLVVLWTDVYKDEEERNFLLPKSSIQMHSSLWLGVGVCTCFEISYPCECDLQSLDEEAMIRNSS